jgi:branched-chain amino acid transport system substrate-binding protein
VLATQAYFDEINAKGGVDGYKFKELTCDNQSSPTLASNCLKSLTDNSSVVALVGLTGIDQNPPTGIAVIGETLDSPGEPTQSNSFPLAGFQTAGSPDYAVEGAYAKSKGYNSPGVVTCEVQGCISGAAQVQEIFAPKKVPVVTSDLANVDLTPQVTTLQHDGVNFVISIEATAGTIGSINAAKQIGYNPLHGLGFNCYDPHILAQVATSAAAICPQPFKITSSTLSPMTEAMNKYIGTGKWESNVYAVNSWLAGELFVKDISGIKGAITRSSVLAGMDKVTSFSSPLLPYPIDYAKPGPVKAYPAVKNWWWYVYSVKNHQLSAPGAPINAAKLNIPSS